MLDASSRAADRHADPPEPVRALHVATGGGTGAGRLREITGPELLDLGEPVTPGEALAAQRKGLPDLVFLEAPIDDALEPLRAILSQDPDAIVVILTHGTEPTANIRALAAGAFGHVDLHGDPVWVAAAVARACRVALLQRDRHRLQEFLIRERNHWLATINHLSVGVLTLDWERRSLGCNPAFGTITGLDPARVRGLDDLLATIQDAPARDRVRAAAAGALAGQDERFLADLAIVRPGSGQPVTVELGIIPMRMTPPVGAALVLMLNDVSTERELNRKLLHAERLAAIGEMASVVAHELRNPLAGVSGAMDVLLGELPPQPDLVRIRDEIKVQLRRLTTVTTDLLNFAKPVAVHPHAITLRDLMGGLRGAIRRNPVFARARVEVAGEDTPLQVDPVHFPQVLLNVLINAVQAAGPEGRLQIAASATGATVRLTLDDDGPGFTADALSRAFQPFFTTKSRGTGLGLPTCRKIVEAHGGTMTAHNRPEGGARITITLPAAPALASA